MRAHEFIAERTVKQDIHDYLTKKRGYQFVSHGSVKTAYRDPKTGWVFLIAPDEGKGGAQRSFQEWAKFCAANRGNPNLPDFKELRLVEFQGQRYIATFVEPLKKPTSEQSRWQAVAVTHMLSSADKGEDADDAWLSTLRALNAIDPRLGKRLPAMAPEVPKRDEQDVLEIMGGREKWLALWNLVTRVVAQGHRLGFTIDYFTPGNVLQDQQGNIVISDPWAEFG